MANFISMTSKDGIAKVVNEDAISVVKEVEGGIYIYLLDESVVPMTTEFYPADTVMENMGRFLGARSMSL